MENDHKLRIALECRVEDLRSGIGSAILALADALSASKVVDQEYTFLIYSDVRSWLEPHIFGPCRLVAFERPKPSRIKGWMKNFTLLRGIWRAFRTKHLTPPQSDGYVESERFDVVHFITQVGYRTSRPSIYQPHDLQHLHYPEFFTKEEFDFREKTYRTLAEQATFVCVQTEWSKEDVIEKLGIERNKVAVVRWGCVIDAYDAITSDNLEAARCGLGTPPEFLFYPAVTWPHKNHECILRALHLLRDKYGRTVHVCFSGRSTEHRAQLEALASQLDIAQQIHYLGFVTPVELQALYLSAKALLYPSKFEGFGLPILEAFRFSLPVICARSSCLPEVAQDAALYFDPELAEELALRIIEVLDDSDRRTDLALRGSRVLSVYSFKKTAAAFQDLYTTIIGRSVPGSPTQPSHEIRGTTAQVEAR
jgi:glycosyltransferase involved in cell wall biosynthesis